MTSKLGLTYYDDNKIKIYSEATNVEIDEEIAFIISSASEICWTLIQEHKEKVIRLSDKLLSQETLNHEDIITILGPRPFLPSKAYEQYFNEYKKKE